MDIQFVFVQLFNGLALGSFYVLLSLGLTIIFGMLGVVNFAHGALYMLGADRAYTWVQVYSGNFWIAVILSPLIVGLIGMVMEGTLLRKLYDLPALLQSSPHIWFDDFYRGINSNHLFTHGQAL